MTDLTTLEAELAAAVTAASDLAALDAYRLCVKVTSSAALGPRPLYARPLGPASCRRG